MEINTSNLPANQPLTNNASSTRLRTEETTESQPGNQSSNKVTLSEEGVKLSTTGRASSDNSINNSDQAQSTVNQVSEDLAANPSRAALAMNQVTPMIVKNLLG